jgi:DNA-3-methyladenine glycosylase
MHAALLLETGLPLRQDFYNRDPVVVARDLLGKLLVRRTRDGLCSGRIVETEAYLARNDEACHASRGKTRRNAAMFGPPGRAYVYRIHRVFCVNVVTEPEDTASAVLIRAIEPLAGVDLMKRRAGKAVLHHVCRGPGLLCRALAIDPKLDGWDLTQGRRLWIAAGDGDECEIITSPRIGVGAAKELPLRFFVSGHACVSGRKTYRAPTATARLPKRPPKKDGKSR